MSQNLISHLKFKLSVNNNKAARQRLTRRERNNRRKTNGAVDRNWQEKETNNNNSRKIERAKSEKKKGRKSQRRADGLTEETEEKEVWDQCTPGSSPSLLLGYRRQTNGLKVSQEQR